MMIQLMVNLNDDTIKGKFKWYSLTYFKIAIKVNDDTIKGIFRV